jgi:hypothetical protein
VFFLIYDLCHKIFLISFGMACITFTVQSKTVDKRAWSTHPLLGSMLS